MTAVMLLPFRAVPRSPGAGRECSAGQPPGVFANPQRRHLILKPGLEEDSP